MLKVPSRYRSSLEITERFVSTCHLVSRTYLDSGPAARVWTQCLFWLTLFPLMWENLGKGCLLSGPDLSISQCPFLFSSSPSPPPPPPAS